MKLIGHDENFHWWLWYFCVQIPDLKILCAAKLSCQKKLVCYYCIHRLFGYTAVIRFCSLCRWIIRLVISLLGSVTNCFAKYCPCSLVHTKSCTYFFPVYILKNDKIDFKMQSLEKRALFTVFKKNSELIHVATTNKLHMHINTHSQ